MAVTPVSLKVGSYEPREVQFVTYEFDRATDVEGQLAGIPRGGKIEIKVKALNDGNSDLCAWMTDKNLAKDGEIIFLETKSGNKMKSIQFKTAYCIGYTEDWAEGKGHSEKILITCKDIIFNGAEYHNEWK